MDIEREKLLNYAIFPCDWNNDGIAAVVDIKKNSIINENKTTQKVSYVIEMNRMDRREKKEKK